MKGNLLLAVIGGLIASLVGAAIWAGVTVTTQYQIGWMAIGVGFLVGYAVRFLGKGSSVAFGVVGGAFALIGCALGNLLSTVGFLAQETRTDVLEAMTKFDWSQSFVVLQSTWQPIDLLFYGIALYEGFKLSRVPELQ